MCTRLALPSSSPRPYAVRRPRSGRGARAPNGPSRCRDGIGPRRPQSGFPCGAAGASGISMFSAPLHRRGASGTILQIGCWPASCERQAHSGSFKKIVRRTRDGGRRVWLGNLHPGPLRLLAGKHYRRLKRIGPVLRGAPYAQDVHHFAWQASMNQHVPTRGVQHEFAG
jgi:hypothetical protein